MFQLGTHRAPHLEHVERRGGGLSSLPGCYSRRSPDTLYQPDVTSAEGAPRRHPKGRLPRRVGLLGSRTPREASTRSLSLDRSPLCHSILHPSTSPPLFRDLLEPLSHVSLRTVHLINSFVYDRKICLVPYRCFDCFILGIVESMLII